MPHVRILLFIINNYIITSNFIIICIATLVRRGGLILAKDRAMIVGKGIVYR